MENEFLNILFSRSVWHTRWMWHLASDIQNWLDPQGYPRKLPTQNFLIDTFLIDFLWGTCIGLLALKKIKYCCTATLHWFLNGEMMRHFSTAWKPETCFCATFNQLFHHLYLTVPRTTVPIFFFWHDWTFLSAFTNSVSFQDIMQSANLSKSWYFYLFFLFIHSLRILGDLVCFPHGNNAFWILPPFLCTSSHFSQSSPCTSRNFISSSFILKTHWMKLVLSICSEK